MTLSQESDSARCYRPLVEALGDAAQCNVCGAARGEPCRLARGSSDPETQQLLDRADALIAYYHGDGPEPQS